MNTLYFTIRVRGGQHHRFAEAMGADWLRITTDLILRREPENLHDAFAIKVFVLTPPPSGEEIPIGYVAARQAKQIAPLLDEGAVIARCVVLALDATALDAELTLTQEEEPRASNSPPLDDDIPF